MANEQEELIRQYIDRDSFGSDTKFVIDQLSQLESEYKKLRDFRTGLQGASGIKDVASNAAAATTSIKGMTDAISSQTGTINKNVDSKTKMVKVLKDEEIEAQKRLKTQRLQTQAENEVIKQILLEEKAEQELLKTKKLRAAEEGKTKAKATPEAFDPNSIPYTNNLADLEKEKQALSDTGTVISDYDRKLREAQIAAAEFYGEQGSASKITKEQAEAIKDIALKYDKYSGSLTDNLQVQIQNTAAIKENKDQQKAITDAIGKNGSLTDEQAKKLAVLKTAAVQLTAENKMLNSTINAQAKEAISANGTLDQLSSQLLILRQAYSGLTDQEKATPFGKEIIAEIDILDPKVKALDAQIGNFQKNVGNYPKAASAAVAVLNQELSKISTKLSSMDKSSPGFDQLSKQSTFLKSVIDGLDKTFSNSRTEMRAMQEAAKRVGTEFGVTSTQFKKFTDIVGDRKDEHEDIQKAINYKASDTKGLDTIVQGVQAVVGAYGAYQAVVALSGVKNEELEQSMQKLQAALTLVTSVQSVANALQSEGALIQGLLAAKASFLAVAEKAAAIATGEHTAAAAAEAAASGAAAIAVTELAAAEAAAAVGTGAIAGTAAAAAVAMEAEAVAAGTLAVGLEAVTVAEGGVAAGAVAASTAIAATGIGLLIIGLSIAVYKLVQALKSMDAANESVVKANAELVTSMKDLVNATKEYETIRALSTKNQLDDLRKLNELRKAAGVTALQQLAMDKQIAVQQQKMADDDAKRYNVTEQTVKTAMDNARSDADVVRIAEKNKRDYLNKTAKDKDKNFDEELEKINKGIESRKKEADASKSILDFALDIYGRQNSARQQIRVLDVEAEKLSADERRKLLLESARIESEIQTAKNNLVLSNDRSTLKEQIAALKDNLAERRKVAAAENAAIQNDPTVSDTDKKLSSKRAAADIKIATGESEAAIAKLKEDYRLRDLAAVTEVQKEIFQVISDTNAAIMDNEAVTEAERLEALRKSLDARKAIIDTDFGADLSSAGISRKNIERIKNEGFFEIANKKITDEELKKLIAEYNNSVIALSREVNDKRIAITKDYYEKDEDLRNKSMRAIERENDLLSEDKTDTYNNQIIDLNEYYKKGLIETDRYNKDRLKIDADYSKASIQLEIDKIEKSLKALESAKDVEKKIRTELAELQKFTGPRTDEEKKLHADRIKRLTEELTKIQEVVGKETELYKALSKLKKDLSDADAKNFSDSQQKIVDALDVIKKIAGEVISIISGAMNAVAISQKNRLADQSNAIEQNSQREIEAVNASVLSEQDKAAKIAIINARAQAQKDQIAAKQKKIDQDNARSQKAFAAFQILIDTAINVAKAFTIPGKIFAAVSGAAQLALVLATPIPRFKMGKTSDYEGPGVVNDGPDQEYIKRADGTIEKPIGKNVLTHVGKKDVIYPNLKAMMKSLAMPSLGIIADNKIDNAESFSRLESALLAHTPLLNQIANKRENHLSAKDGALVSLWKHGANTTRYIDENTNW